MYKKNEEYSFKRVLPTFILITLRNLLHMWRLLHCSRQTSIARSTLHAKKPHTSHSLPPLLQHWPASPLPSFEPHTLHLPCHGLQPLIGQSARSLKKASISRNSLRERLPAPAKVSPFFSFALSIH